MDPGSAIVVEESFLERTSSEGFRAAQLLVLRRSLVLHYPWAYFNLLSAFVRLSREISHRKSTKNLLSIPRNWQKRNGKVHLWIGGNRMDGTSYLRNGDGENCRIMKIRRFVLLSRCRIIEWAELEEKICVFCLGKIFVEGSTDRNLSE